MPDCLLPELGYSNPVLECCWYRTEMLDAGILMLAASASMLMCSYEITNILFASLKLLPIFENAY